MKKIVFLGCENSHASMFLNFINNNKKYADIEVLGVYSHDYEAMRNLSDKFSVKAMSNYDEAAQMADGIVITARNGDFHFKYALPYIKKNRTLFIDKPITIDENESVRLMKACQSEGIKITGGSSLRFDNLITNLKEQVKRGSEKTLGGIVRCPISVHNSHGGFFFYAQHLVESVAEIFGRYPLSVHAFQGKATITVIFRYSDYDVTGVFADECYHSYYAARFTETSVVGGEFTIDGSNPCFEKEWDMFYDLLSGEKQQISYKDFIAPVFVMNAIKRSLDSGKEEMVKEYEL